MDVRRLEFLRELAERGTVGAVADAMKVTPSAVSQQLKALEREAGYTLLEPAGRGVALPKRAVHWPARPPRSRSPSERAEGRWREFMEQPAGRVTLRTFPTGGEMLLPGLLTRMAERPDVELVCTDENGTVDFADLTPDHDIVVADSPTTADSWHDRNLKVVPLMSEPLDVALPEDHPLARKESLSPKDVAGETWIGVPHDYPFDSVLDRWSPSPVSRCGWPSASPTTASSSHPSRAATASRSCLATPPVSTATVS